MGCGILCSQATACATEKKDSLLEDTWNPNTRELAVQMTGLCGRAEWETSIERGSQSVVVACLGHAAVSSWFSFSKHPSFLSGNQFRCVPF